MKNDDEQSSLMLAVIGIIPVELAVSKCLHDIEDGAEFIGKKGTIRTARNIIERLYCIHADNCLCNKFFNPSKLPKKIQMMALQSKNRKLKYIKICSSHG